jgi:hypothetical protein
MSNCTWRQKNDIDPMREWIRKELPGPGFGMVVEDIDVAIRRYGKNYGLDDYGDLMLIEKKEEHGRTTPGQVRVYNWINDYAKGAADRWRGWHLIKIEYTKDPTLCNHCGQPNETPESAYNRFVTARLFWNAKPISHNELKEILEGRVSTPQARVISEESLICQTLSEKTLEIQNHVYLVLGSTLKQKKRRRS